MNKTDLIDHIAGNTGITKVDVKKALDAQAAAVHEAVNRGDEVVLDGIGKIKVSQRKARTGRNPRTGEAISIAARNTPTFVAAKALKDAVNG